MRNAHYAQTKIGQLVKPFYIPLAQKINNGIFAVEMYNPNLGFFAKLNWSLFILFYCEKRGLTPYIEITSPNYLSPDRGRDWFKYYFINQAILEKGHNSDYRPKYITRIRSCGTLNLPDWCNSELTVETAARLFRASFSICPDIATAVDEYATANFSDRKILGIHFRGTDKTIEAPRVNWDYCLKTARNYLDEHTDTSAIFVSSDEANFIQHIKKKFRDIDIICHADSYRSSGGLPVHKNNAGDDNYLKGKDALVNSLLLSRCSTVIRSSSFLSAWSSIFNPALRVILMNKPHDHSLWFPEVEIMKKSLDKYLPVQADHGI